MFGDVFNFNGMFGKVSAGMCRLDLKGRVAIKTRNGYKAYDLEKKCLINCANFCFNIADEMFFVIPTAEIEVGDIILVHDLPKCVIKVEDDMLTVINYEDGTVESIVPERHMFMGNVYFYGKIVSMMGNLFKSEDGETNGFENLIKFKIMGSMLNGKGGNSGMDGLLPLMLMQGNGNMFSGMFDNMLGGFFKKKKKANNAEAYEDKKHHDVIEGEILNENEY